MCKKIISVIIPTHKSLSFLKRTILCLEKQKPDTFFFESIVVDDGSNDKTEVWLRRYQGSLDLKSIIFPKNKGRSAARNAGVKISTCSLLLFLDGDMEFDEYFVLNHAKSHYNDNHVTIGRVKYDLISSCRGYAKYLTGRGVMKLDSREIIPGRYFLSGNSSLSRDLFDSVGGFDVGLKSYGEDIDFGVRLESEGAQFQFNSELTVQHLHIRSLDTLFKLSREYGRVTIPELVERYPELRKELKLDWVQKSGITGIIRRLLLRRPFYYIAIVIVRVLNEFRAPGLLYSYLIFRNYYYGYLEHTKEEANT
ncbi:MAG: glycosyltransferase family 2 protein [Calditrichaeota bacterium]|jgi:glycosyltransferase involved in cell wall biosynthesis|nr:glycosyltransferase family 2 protein [Calditrichota bacterium]MBT7619148.1 glycosyltransferase family 2 protein [Calditrichota bacterium]MBT7789056.1 glycosyltransferase family 2 protein [Calditrichota bacterium]